MARWLKEQGVVEDKIITESRAYSTEENAIHSFRILSEQYPDVDTVVLVSSDYHLRRCKTLFYAETVLKGMDDRYTVAGWAGYDAGHEGAEDPPNDAESLGPMAGIYIDKGYVPKLCKLTEIIVEGNDSCMAGDPPPFAVSAIYNNGFFRDVTEDAVIADYDPMAAGTQEITISYTENGITFSETRSLTVIPLPTETIQPTQPPTTQPMPTTEPQPTQPPEEPEVPETPPDASNEDQAFRITNSPLDEETSVTVHKVWDYGFIAPGKDHEQLQVTVALLTNGVNSGRTVTLNLRNNWRGTFSGLPYKDSKGNVISYTVEERWNNNDWIPYYGEIEVVNGDPPTYTTTITNVYRRGTGAELPSTGSAARLAYILCGGSIMLTSLVYGIGLRRKRERGQK
jgi:hypothetical protein